MFGLGWRYVLAAVVIGAGSSAVATILFTQAFVVGTDFVTPVVLQKVQPIVAVIAARIILGERCVRASRSISARRSSARG